MSVTHQFGLPLVQASQAQKHVTVNEALALLDAVAQLRLQSKSVSVPPVALDGEAYGVPSGGVNDWDGHGGEIAVFSNGGWVFVSPMIGWRAWIGDESRFAVFDGFGWQADVVVLGVGGASTGFSVVEFDHVISAGATSATTVEIQNGEQVIGVTARVIDALTGALTAWELGVGGASNRYGTGLSLNQNSWVRGLSGSPVTYWSDTPLLLAATGGDFAGGTVRFAIHSVRLEPPRVG